MKKEEFEEVKKKYEDGKKRLERITRGDFVWEGPGYENDHFAAIVVSVNVDEDYVEVIDVTQQNARRTYGSFQFKTEAEMLKEGFSKEGLEKEYQTYSDIRKKVMSGELK